METLEKSRMCRLCGKNSGISIDIFDKNENHVRKINAILPILVHEMDLLPKQMCHRCSYKLEEFYNFYVECAKTDTDLKSQLSWMRKENLEEKIITPMVKMNPYKIKTEPADDSMDSNILGQISESSLLFPASILQSYDVNASPMLSCTRCQCLCNTNIKINKTSPKPMDNSPIVKESDKQADSSDVSNGISELETPKTVDKEDKEFTFRKDIFDGNSCKELNNKIAVISLDSNDCIKLDSNGRDNLSKSDKLNRALRPRKGSVDYMGQKKKGVSFNLKAKLKNRLDMLDPELVNPVEVKVTQSNTTQSSPVIKLEKVEDQCDTMRTLRTRKNLEEFNKRIKEFQRKRNLYRRENKNGPLFQRGDDDRKKSFQREEKQNRKSLQREENLRRQSLQKEEHLNRKSISREENSHRKSMQREDNAHRKSMQREDGPSKKKLQKEEAAIKKSVQPDESSNRKSLQKEETQTKGLEESIRNEQCLSTNKKTDSNEGVTRIPDIIIKQEIVNKIVEVDKPMEEQLVQEKSSENSPKDSKASKSVDKHPLCAVVKLEKDYTCNVDYPRIKIKRQLAVANSSQSQEGALDSSIEERSIFKTNLDSSTNSDNNFSPKNLRSKEKRLKDGKVINKLKKVSKKKGKKLEFGNIKHAILEKGLTVAPPTDVKRYCEECDSSFKNKELFKLHPCYQK